VADVRILRAGTESCDIGVVVGRTMFCIHVVRAGVFVAKMGAVVVGVDRFVDVGTMNGSVGAPLQARYRAVSLLEQSPAAQAYSMVG